MADGICSIDGCTSAVVTRGWCKKHYVRWWRNGDPNVTMRRPTGDPPISCSVENCDGPARTNGLCQKHYHRWRKANIPVTTVCSVEGCDQLIFHKGSSLCAMHYTRVRRRGDPLAIPMAGPNAPHPECSVDGCDRVSFVHGMCAMHYHRWQTHGDPTKVAVAGQLSVETYHNAHQRVTATKGPAAEYACVDCGTGASQWSFRHRDASMTLTDPGGRTFSSDPDDYDPRCHRCHVKYDRAASSPMTVRGDIISGDGREEEPEQPA